MKNIQKKLDKAPITTYIESLSHDGRGIARIDGKTTFIQGALAHETVTFEYIRKKKDYDEGKTLTVNEKSSLRVKPKCQYFEICGGCSMQHLNAEAQIDEKQKLLFDILDRIGKCSPQEIMQPITSSSWHYRNKARLSVRHVVKKDATLIGFREKNNPRYITDINTCLILNKKIADELENLSQILSNFDDKCSIAQIEVAAGDTDVALIFRNLNPLSLNDESKLKAFSDRTAFKIFLQPGGEDSVYLLHPANTSSYLTYSLDDFGITYKFYPTDFTQVNAGINQKMVRKAIEMLDLNSEDVVLDLFCGLGNFSLPIAKSAKQVIAVEGSQAMVDRGLMNAVENAITNITFKKANLNSDDIYKDLIHFAANKLLIDPPRTGALEIVKNIDKFNIKRIVYVSCNPATLARDADILVNQHGYKMISAGVMDMFPHTSHVESIALFIG
jgi:23S rRNA (uracil1939-C5)-methyltransferase